MDARLRRRRRRVVLNGWDLRRRRAAEGTELAREVRLVGVSVLRGEARERHRAEASSRRLEADQARGDLWRGPHLLGEALAEMPARASEGVGQRIDAHV